MTYDNIKQALEDAAKRYGIDPFTGLPKQKWVIIDSLNELEPFEFKRHPEKEKKEICPGCAIMHKQEK